MLDYDNFLPILIFINEKKDELETSRPFPPPSEPGAWGVLPRCPANTPALGLGTQGWGHPMKSGGGALPCSVHSEGLPQPLHIRSQWSASSRLSPLPREVRQLGRVHLPGAPFPAIRGTEAPSQRGKAWPEKGTASRVSR